MIRWCLKTIFPQPLPDLPPHIDADGFGGPDELRSFRDFPDLAGQLRQGDQNDIRRFQGHHMAEFSLSRCFHGETAQPRAQHPVECRGRSAPLNMAENGGPYLKINPFFDLLRQMHAHAAQLGNPLEAVGGGVLKNHVSSFFPRAFRPSAR